MTTTHTPGSIQSLQDTNRLAFALYRTAVEAVDAYGREHGWPVAPGLFAAYEAALQDLHRSAVAVCDVFPPVGSIVWTPDGHGMLVADATSNVTLTGDGRPYDRTDAHVGPQAETVYVERYASAGRTFHGYVDSVSRRLVQAG